MSEVLSFKRSIVTLPQSVANRIAAGEVVERPSAVVKELIENSLDAQASEIDVIIEDAGRTLIRIIDNGVGIPSDDISKAFLRHSTSKLSRFEDLESLVTFGFRGEALPSISAISKLEIVSRTKDQELGTLVRFNGGSVEVNEPVSADVGTSISVHHLFFNVPARRKFLRTDATEFKWIANVFRCFVLAFPRVTWRLYRNGELIYSLSAADERKRLSDIYGDDIGENVIPVDYQKGWLTVKGFITPPDLMQKSNQEQYIFLNKRHIVSQRLFKAVYTAVEPFNVSGGNPLFTLFLEASPEYFDINVHPAKKEVKFVDENGAYGIVWAAVRDAVSLEKRSDIVPPKQVQAPSQSMNKENKDFTARLKSGEFAARVPVDAPSHLTPFVAVPNKYLDPRLTSAPFPADNAPHPDQGSVVRMFNPEDTSPNLSEFETANISRKSDKDGPFIWQIFDTFLVSQLKTGVAFFDQHIAHERILYEKALRAMNGAPWTSQRLLFPLDLSIVVEDVPLLEEAMPLIASIGFEIEQVGPKDFRISAVPVGVDLGDENELINGIIRDYRENQSTQRDPRLRIAAAFACRSAIKAGQPLEISQMRQLIDELFLTNDPEFCPHGRPIYHILSLKDIEKWFKR